VHLNTKSALTIIYFMLINLKYIISKAKSSRHPEEQHGFGLWSAAGRPELKKCGTPNRRPKQNTPQWGVFW
jgi:hypothetical protein